MIMSDTMQDEQGYAVFEQWSAEEIRKAVMVYCSPNINRLGDIIEHRLS